ncbi:MAG TPA: zf-HC2 domain-containing protein [Longimicrobium sp.]|nr:zf-HC2 domain-containing protein [Longimicrobium sp.]
MNHEYVLERLDEWVAHELADEDRQAVEFHLAVCGDCRAEAEALRALLDDVATLPLEMAPGRDLWAGIAARIEPQADVVPITSARRWQAPRWLTMAATIVGVAVSSSLITLKVMERRAPEPVAVAPVQSVAPPSTATPTALVAFKPAEEDYEVAIADLERVLTARRTTLAPETVNTLETNLRIIDEAIRQSRAALVKDPNSRELTDMLADAYGQKLKVLQHAVEL